MQFNFLSLMKYLLITKIYFSELLSLLLLELFILKKYIEYKFSGSLSARLSHQSSYSYKLFYITSCKRLVKFISLKNNDFIMNMMPTSSSHSF